MEFQGPPCLSGRKRARSNTSDSDKEIVVPTDILCQTLKNSSRPVTITKPRKRQRRNVPSSCMPECPLPNNENPETCNVKSNSSNNTVQSTTKSSKTSDQASTSNAQDCLPFWSKSKEEMSKKLWSPIETGLHASESSYLNVHSQNTERYSTWFQVKKQTLKVPSSNSQKIYSQFVTFLWPRTMEGEPLPMLELDAHGSLKLPKLPLSEKDQTKLTKDLGDRVATRKIKLHPRNNEDREFLMRMFGVARWTYNKTVSTIKDPLVKQEQHDNKVHWRTLLCRKIVNMNSPSMQENPWLKELAHDIRNDAVKDVLTAMKGNKTKLENGSIKGFQLSFRSRKHSPSESLYFRTRWIGDCNGKHLILNFPNRSQPLVLWIGSQGDGDWLQNRELWMDCRLQRTWNNDFFLCIPVTYEQPQQQSTTTVSLGVDNQDPFHRQNLRVCSLDPGVRTFQTVYDVNQGEALQVGDKDMRRLFRLCQGLDRLVSKTNVKGTPSKKRYSYRRAAKRLRRRIKNLVREVHCQLAKHLASNYDLVMIPKFDVSRMVVKDNGRDARRKIGSKTVRQMLCWGHYGFRQRLIHKARQLGRCRVVVVNEAYTSKTCSECGTIKHNLGARKCFSVVAVMQ